MLPILGITMGDPSGIGAEIAVKALDLHDWTNKCVPLVIGDYAAMQDAINFTHAKSTLKVVESPEEVVPEKNVIPLIDMKYLQPGSWPYKKVGALQGEAAFNYVKKATELAIDKRINAIVTGPINKESINLAGYHYSGHTEILADLTHQNNFGMLLISDKMRVIHVTTHVSMREACDRITKERVYNVIRLADGALKDLGLTSGKIGVAGFNAHCSENGLFGDQEEKGIIPAIEKAQAEGINVEGPVPPDTVFVKALAGQYDIVVAMYHDQGHIPLKLSGFKLDLKTNKYTSMSGVNCTVGLPIIRTSVDHGTAFGKAGEGRANEESLVDAMNIAIQMAKSRFGIGN